MATVTLIGIDIGKHSFHLVGHDAHGQVLLKRQFGRHPLIDFLARHPACCIVMEACCGAHWLARKLAGFGHAVQLIAPQYGRPFVQGNKNDFLDAQAMCEAASRPAMRYVAVKSPEQQAQSALHRLREARIRERVQTGNQIHASLLAFGLALPQGVRGLQQAHMLLREHDAALPEGVWRVLEQPLQHHDLLPQEIETLDREIAAQAKQDDVARRLMTVPGIGPITASQLAADAGKAKLLGISKRGDKSLRRLLVQCAHVIMQRAAHWDSALAQWTAQLMLRRPSQVVACAVANKLARVVWAILTQGGEYRPHPRAGM